MLEVVNIIWENNKINLVSLLVIFLFANLIFNIKYYFIIDFSKAHYLDF